MGKQKRKKQTAIGDCKVCGKHIDWPTLSFEARQEMDMCIRCYLEYCKAAGEKFVREEMERTGLSEHDAAMKIVQESAAEVQRNYEIRTRHNALRGF